MVSEEVYKPQTTEEQWKTFKATFFKSYDADEDKRRFQIFKERLQKMEKHNEKYDAGRVGVKLIIDQFGDLTNEEFLVAVGRL